MVSHYTEFALTAPHPPYCNGSPTGCVVCAVANVKREMLGKATTDLTALGASMGVRCRATYHTCHGDCSRGCAWGVCCAYLQLKAEGVPVGYSRLTHAQIKAQLQAGHPVIIAGIYSHIPSVAVTSYSSVIPSHGRSDSFSGTHGIVLWKYFADDTIQLSDADFGSPGRKVVPPYSRVKASAVFAMYDSKGWNAVYTLHARPIAPAPVAVPSGVVLKTQWGAKLAARGQYKVTATAANERSTPFIHSAHPADNVVRVLPHGTLFYCRQTAYAGTNVGGSPVWHGNGPGTLWLHHSMVAPV